MPASPRRQTHIIRWMSKGASLQSLQVTALKPGAGRLGVALAKDESGGYAITVTGADNYERIIRVTRALNLKP